MATASDVLTRTRELINDVASDYVAGLRWSNDELLQWLTDGQREIVDLKPEANMVTDLFTVVGGFPRQRLNPGVASRLIRVEANGTAASTPMVFNVVFTTELGEIGVGVNVLLEGEDSGYVFGSLDSSEVPADYYLRGLYSNDLVIGGQVILSIGSPSGPPPEDFFSTLTIYEGGEFSGDPFLTLSIDNASTVISGDNENDRQWAWAGTDHVFNTRRGEVFSARLT